MRSFSDWLREIGLEGYAAVFAQNEVDFDVVRSLNDADLQTLGLSLGARKRLLQALARPDEEHSAASTQPTPPASAAAETVGSGAERRQLTVMFCDLVGSVALSQLLDPEELRGLIQAYRAACAKVIARYEGYIARYVGDGILVYFGWPKAHEEDAERSIRSALEIIRAVKDVQASEPLSVHIGIATGPVVVGQEASESAEAKLAVGTTPNLAARLQELAASDELVIAASTRRLVGTAFELIDLGEHVLKGIAEPVKAWRVEGLAKSEERFEATRGAGHLTGDAYRQALALATELGLRPLVAHCHFGLGKLHARTGQREEVKEHLVIATTLYREMDMRFWLETAEVSLNEVGVR